MHTPHAILFLGIENARISLLAEAILGYKGEARFRAYSAGSHPAAAPEADLIAFLAQHDYRTQHMRTKSWDEFAGEGAPALDVVVTLHNRLIGEICPVFWTGRPVSSHWPMPENSMLDECHAILSRRISALVALPLGELDAVTLQMRLDAIGRL